MSQYTVWSEDFEPDEASVELGWRIALLLMKVENGDRLTPLSASVTEEEESECRLLAGGVPIQDVLTSMKLISLDLATYELAGVTPCFALTDMVPLSLKALGAYAFQNSPEKHTLFTEQCGSDTGEFGRSAVFDEALEKFRHGPAWLMNPHEASNELRWRLGEFLALRLAASKEPNIATDELRRTTADKMEAERHHPSTHLDFDGKMRVTVTSLLPGLRILVSPAYFVDWVFFGAPSSPVTGALAPGRYIFGTDRNPWPDKSGDSVDPIIFNIPSDYKPFLRGF